MKTTINSPKAQEKVRKVAHFPTDYKPSFPASTTLSTHRRNNSMTLTQKMNKLFNSRKNSNQTSQEGTVYLDLNAKKATPANNLQLRGPSSMYYNLGVINPQKGLNHKIQEYIKMQKESRMLLLDQTSNSPSTHTRMDAKATQTVSGPQFDMRSKRSRKERFMIPSPQFNKGGSSTIFASRELDDIHTEEYSPLKKKDTLASSDLSPVFQINLISISQYPSSSIQWYKLSNNFHPNSNLPIFVVGIA